MRDELEQIRDLEAENKKLKAQVARIAEALKNPCSCTFLSDRIGCKDDCPTMKALSSHDPSWLREAREEVLKEVFLRLNDIGLYTAATVVKDEFKDKPHQPGESKDARK